MGGKRAAKTMEPGAENRPVGESQKETSSAGHHRSLLRRLVDGVKSRKQKPAHPEKPTVGDSSAGNDQDADHSSSKQSAQRNGGREVPSRETPRAATLPRGPEDAAVRHAYNTLLDPPFPLPTLSHGGEGAGPMSSAGFSFSSSSSSSAALYKPPSEENEREEEGRGAAEGDRRGRRGTARDGALASPFVSPSASPSGSSDTFTEGPKSAGGKTASATSSGSHSRSYSSSYSSTSSSASDDSCEGASNTVGVFSRASQRSQAASSRMAEPGSPLFPGGHTTLNGMAANSHMHYREDGVVLTQDHRSALVSTMDVEVFMAKRMIRRQQNTFYLQARWGHMRRAAANQGDLYASAAAVGAELDPFGLPVNVELDDFYDVKARNDTLYLRNMDSLVELYLKANPIYGEALSRFQAHLPRDEQRLRTNDCAEAYTRASRSVLAKRPSDEKAAKGVTPPSQKAVDGEAAAASHTRWWQLSKTDIELIGADSARRGRFADDTLPWRPVNFNAVNIKLEPLEHHQIPFDELSAGAAFPGTFTGGGAAHDMTGSGASVSAQPAVGGSVNLLLEVLILTETDPPYTSGVPASTFTNHFIFLASYFALPDVLVCKFIRLFRSIRRWGANPDDCEDERRPSNLMRRLLQCLAAYLRCHEMDLTLVTIQRLACFMESSGFANPVTGLGVYPSGSPHAQPPPDLQPQREPLFDVWPCTEGVYDARRTSPHPGGSSHHHHGAGSGHEGHGGAAGICRGNSKLSATSHATMAAPQSSSFSAVFYPSMAHLAGAHGSHFGLPGDGAARPTPAPLPPLDADVTQVFMELSLFVRQFFERHYARLEILPAFAAADLVSRNAARSFSPWAHGLSDGGAGGAARRKPLAGARYGRSHYIYLQQGKQKAAAVETLRGGFALVDSGAARYRLGTMYTASVVARRAQAAAGVGIAGPTSVFGRTSHGPAHFATASSVSGGGAESVGAAAADGDSQRTNNTCPGTSAVARDTDANEDADSDNGDDDMEVATHAGGGGVPSADERSVPGSQHDHYRSGARDANSGSAPGAGAGGQLPSPNGPRESGGSTLQAQLHAVSIDAELLSHQLNLLTFSLFSAIHIRELLNNAWTDPDMRRCVSFHLHEFMEFNSRLQRWTAAVIVTPATWAASQQSMRHLLEVCRRLYEQQNYQVASAILGGLRHPAVEVVEKMYNDSHVEPMLSGSEQRDLETLQELMNPFAVYSPSSLNSVTARAAGEMERPMIPLLSPILGVLFRTEDSKGQTVTVRASDGQAAVNWSKLTAAGKILSLWLQCQYTPYTYAVDATLQEYLWSIRFHQWTDSMLIRVARRTKREASSSTTEDAADDGEMEGPGHKTGVRA